METGTVPASAHSATTPTPGRAAATPVPQKLQREDGLVVPPARKETSCHGAAPLRGVTVMTATSRRTAVTPVVATSSMCQVRPQIQSMSKIKFLLKFAGCLCIIMSEMRFDIGTYRLSVYHNVRDEV